MGSRTPICGVANGIPNWMDRIKALGNSVVPLQTREAFKKLLSMNLYSNSGYMGSN
jgi:hypothetical protein